MEFHGLSYKITVQEIMLVIVVQIPFPIKIKARYLAISGRTVAAVKNRIIPAKRSIIPKIKNNTDTIV